MIRLQSALLVCVAFASHAFGADPWKIQKDQALVVERGVAHDVRWASETQLFVAEGVNGVTVRNSDAPGTVAGYAIAPAKRGGFFFASRMAASPEFVVVASPLGSYTWRARAAGTAVHAPVPIGMVMDADVHGDSLVILGGDTNQKGGTPEGIVSLVSLSKNASSRRILMEGPTGKEGKELARCHFFEAGAVRFLPDGSIIVAPGLAPGVFQYSAAGRLLRTWQTDRLNILDDCRIDDAQMIEMAADFAKRSEWVNRHTIVDEILPFAEGPALLLRTVRNNATTWEVAYLGAEGKITRETLPIRSPSPRAHVRGDVRGSRIVLLLFDYELPGSQPLAPRLILATR